MNKIFVSVKVGLRAYLTFALLVATSFAACSLSSLPTQSIAYAADVVVVETVRLEKSALANTLVDSPSCDCSESVINEGFVNEEYFTFTHRQNNHILPAFVPVHIYHQEYFPIGAYWGYAHRPPPDDAYLFVLKKLSFWQPQLARNFS